MSGGEVRKVGHDVIKEVLVKRIGHDRYVLMGVPSEGSSGFGIDLNHDVMDKSHATAAASRYGLPMRVVER
jgi:hypothetical protein